MMKAGMILAGAATALAWASTAFAAPLGPTSGAPSVGVGDLVHQAQAMCRAPNGGWVPCRALRRPAPRYYAPPPRYYAPPRRGVGSDFCAVTYNRCNDTFGRGSAAYYSCMRQARC